VTGEIMAILFYLFRPSLTVGSIAIYVCSSLTLFYIYKLGTYIYTKQVGFFSALLFSLFPLFAAQSLIFNDAVIATTITLATVYYFVTSQWLLYIIAGILLVLTKEPLITIPFFIGIYTMIKHKSETHSTLAKTILYGVRFWFPIGIFLLWMLLNKLTLHFYLDTENSSLFTLSLGGSTQMFTQYSNRIAYILQFVFLFNGMWIIWLPCIVYIFKRIKRMAQESVDNPLILYFFFFLFFIHNVLYYFGPFNPRYLLPYFPFVFIGSVALLKRLLKKQTFIRVGILMTILLVCTNEFLYFFKRSEYWGESDLKIIQTTTLYSKTFAYVHNSYPNALMITPPEVYANSDAFFGESPDAFLYPCYFWNTATDQIQEMQRMLQYATSNHLEPIIYIQPSYMMDIEAINNLNKQFIHRVTIPYNTVNYHDLYIIKAK